MLDSPSPCKKIYEVSSFKEGSWEELRRFHDTVQGHLGALNAMGKDPSGPLLTSLLQLQLDKDTTFEWQKESQDSTKVPHYNKRLIF